MENKIGLWKRVSQKGNEYFIGKVNLDGKEYQISLFKNNYKENDKQPDYQIILNKKDNKNEVPKTTDEKEYVDFGNQNSFNITDKDIAF